jgi:hypothetical protein
MKSPRRRSASKAYRRCLIRVARFNRVSMMTAMTALQVYTSFRFHGAVFMACVIGAH